MKQLWIALNDWDEFHKYLQSYAVPFWKTYYHDKEHWTVHIIGYLIVTSIFFMIARNWWSPVVFSIGYWMIDPITYYFVEYKKKKKKNERNK